VNVEKPEKSFLSLENFEFENVEKMLFSYGKNLKTSKLFCEKNPICKII
jgi:hypothetical protein